MVKIMKQKNYVDRESRRNALKGMAVLGGAAAASVAAGNAVAAEEAPVKSAAPVKLGYRETDHVREYYRRARF